MTNLIPAVQLIDGHPRVSSLSISEHFEKTHADVLKSVRKITLECPQEFNEGNFSLVNFTDAKGESRPMYQLSRDGFTLVAMGFTGKKALAWKVRYIEAFNAMERALLEGKHGEPVALPPTDTPITPDQQCTLQGMVKALVDKGGIYANIWSRFNNHFRLGSYKQLPQSRMSEAVAYLMQLDVSPKALPEYEQALAPAQVFSGEFSKEELTAIYREVKALNKEWHDLYNFFNQRRRISRRLKELYSPVARVCMARITGVPSGAMYTYPVDWIAETLHSHEGDTDKAFSDAEDAMSLSFARTFNFLYALNEGAFDLLFTRRSNFIP